MFKINHVTKSIEKNTVELTDDIRLVRRLIWNSGYSLDNVSEVDSCNIILDQIGCKKCTNVVKIYDGDTCDKCNKFFCDSCKKRNINYCKDCK